MYAYDNYFYFYDESPDDDTYTFADGEAVTLRISRNGSSSRVTVSLNGTVLWSFTDSSDYAVFNATNNRMRFFEDDSGEHPAGTVTEIRAYSVADDQARPVPLMPALLLLLLTGLVSVLSARRLNI